ncbi:MAG: hypothetical protein ACOX10_03995 [Candidatus Methanomethylophilaceae archaeon]|jgi:hypothetical protein|nr:hypothetical protein AOA81_00655 [Methanomassiliicoccales archaeon RumEn M2]MDI9378684.1 hypothetical protein [Candidatus Thermoplasmatota archaeon]
MASCQMEIIYMDPTTYTAVSDHEMRQAILGELFRSCRKGRKITKQDLADALDIKYQQLVYQLSNHLQDFWKVVGEKKVRGTRMEYIAPSNPHGIYICLGKDRRIYMVDPLAEIYGPLDEVGLRCDKCSVEEAEHCMASLVEKRIVPRDLGISERETLSSNKRSGLRPLDRGIIEALKGVAFGDRCVLVIPCERCSFMNRHNIVMID